MEEWSAGKGKKKCKGGSESSGVCGIRFAIYGVGDSVEVVVEGFWC